MRLIAPNEHAEPERLKAGIKGFVVPVVVLFMVAGNTGLPAWASVAMITLMAWMVLHKLLNPMLMLDSVGLEYRTTLRSIRIRYADVVESKPNSFTGHWVLNVLKEGGGTRTVTLPFEELRKQDRTKLRGVLEGLPREAPAAKLVEKAAPMAPPIPLPGIRIPPADHG